MKKKVLILLIIMIIASGYFFILNKPKPVSNKSDGISVEIIKHDKAEYIGDDGKSIIIVGKSKDNKSEYGTFELKSCNFIIDGKNFDLEETFVFNKLKIEDVINKMDIDDSISSTDVKVYDYNGNNGLGDKKFSLLKCNNSFIFSYYKADFPLDFCAK